MDNINIVCSVREGCSGEIVYACTCGDPVAFICKECIGSHLSELCAHTFISLDQSKELIRNRIRPSDFNRNISRYNAVKIEIQDYIKKINFFKTQISSFKEQILSQIEQTIQSSMDRLDSLKQQAEAALKNIKYKTRSFTSLEDELLNQFDKQGLIGVLEDYLDKVEINSTQISKSLPKVINITVSSSRPVKVDSNINSTNCSIYTAKYSKKKLLKYDLATCSTQEYDLSPIVAKYFNDTSTCCLPDGRVMIVGGGDPIHGDTYRFNPAKGQCEKLAGLNTPRRAVHVCCYGDYIYALGGSHSNKAERMRCSGNEWEKLPDMREPRSLFGSCYKDGRIYLFGGTNSSTIEYYEIKSNKFSIYQNIGVPEGMNVVAVVEDKIYILRQNLIVLSTDLQIIEERRGFHNENFRSISDVIVYNEAIIFYCRDSNTIYSYHTLSHELKRLVSF